MTRSRTVGAFVVAGLVLSLALALFVSPWASPDPDGLERVAADKGLDTGVEEHTFADGPLADYGVKGVDDERLGTGLAGVIGVVVTFAVGLGLFAVLKVSRRNRMATPGGP